MTVRAWLSRLSPKRAGRGAARRAGKAGRAWVVRSFAEAFALLHEAAPTYDRAVRQRPEVGELARRLAVAWGYYRSPNFARRHHAAHLRIVAREVKEVRLGLLWLRYLRMRDDRDLGDLAVVRQWVEADSSEYEAELLKTISLSAPLRRGESVDDWVSRLKKIRTALAASPPD